MLSLLLSFTVFLATVISVMRYLEQYLRSVIDRFRGLLPGGPPIYPFIGTPGIDCPAPWSLMQSWSEKYGKDGLFTYFQGPRLHVAICSPAVAKVLYNDVRLDGKANSTLKTLFKGHGLTFAELNVWKELRKHEVATLRELRGGEVIDHKDDQIPLDFVTDIEKHVDGKAFFMRPHIYKYVVNSLAAVLAGPGLRAEAERSNEFFRNFDVKNDNVYPHRIMNVFPWLKHLPYLRREHETICGHFEDNIETLQHVIAEHRNTYDPHIVRDFIDVSIREQNNSREQDIASVLNDEQLTYMLMEMYFAGYGANLAMLEWAVLLLSSSQYVQRRCREEIHHAIGKSRPITYNERHLLPYCEATMHEIFRIAVVGPVGVARQCVEDTPVPGTSYVVPKGATLFVNYFEFQTSEKYWKNSFTFQPERFLDGAGKFSPNANNHAFGIGDTLTKNLNFVAIVSMLQHFVFQRANPDVPWLDILRINGISVFPEPYQVSVTHAN